MERLIFPNKILRAKIISKYINDAGYKGCVCFSCGNASAALKAEGLWVIDISPSGELIANKWWLPTMIRKVWPDLFDATSGHLPVFLMVEIAKIFKEFLGDLPDTEYEVPTGSGETIICLRWAYPDKEFYPIYNINKATEYNKNAPLNYVVGVDNEALSKTTK